VRKQFASSMTAKFRLLTDESEVIDMEWSLFRSAIIALAVECCGQKRLRVAGDSEKRIPWWSQNVKEAIRAKKDAFKALLQNRSSTDLQSRYTEARKAAALAVKKSKEKSWEQLVRSSVGFQLFIGKQSILPNDPSFTWQKIQLLFLH